MIYDIVLYSVMPPRRLIQWLLLQSSEEKEVKMLRRPCCGPVRVLGTLRGRSLIYAELRKTLLGKRVGQPVVCDRPGCELFPRSLGDALVGV